MKLRYFTQCIAFTTLHKKMRFFPLRISSVNVTKSTFGHIYWRNPCVVPLSVYLKNVFFLNEGYFTIIQFFFYYRAGKIYFYALDFLGTQIYLLVFLREWKTCPQNAQSRNDYKLYFLSFITKIRYATFIFNAIPLEVFAIGFCSLKFIPMSKIRCL